MTDMAAEVVFSSGSGSAFGSTFDTNLSLANCSLLVPSRTPAFVLALQVVVGTTCVLSIVGAALIILTFLAFKDLRTTARQFLANLSVADVIIAASHLVGLFANYERFICSTARGFDAVCAVQGAALMFSTLAAFAWTLAIAVYFCSIVVFKRKTSLCSIVVTYIACWGVPAVLVIGYGAAGYLGFDEEVDVGWCYLRRIDNGNHRNPFPHLLGYELWTYLVFLLLPILYLWVQCYIKIKLKSWPFLTDIKLLFIPLMFLLLRVWNFVLDVAIFYTSESTAEHFKKSHAAAALIMMSGVGDSAQGIVNAVLFIALTKVVRQKFRKLILRCWKTPEQYWTPMRDTDQLESSQKVLEKNGETEETSSLDGSLEPLRVLSFHSSMSSYGTTAVN